MIVHWFIQQNLGTSGDPERIAAACDAVGGQAHLIHRIPFSKDLPAAPIDEPVIFYGSTRFVNLCWETGKWRPAAFFDREKFTTQSWLAAYGERCLNHGAKLTTLAEFCYEPHDDGRIFFVRPDKDLKEFQGGPWSFGDLKRWKTGLLKTDLGDEQLAHIPILVGEPWGISREWRVFIVGGEVCQASQYRVRHKLNVNADVPQNVLDFAGETAQLWSPHHTFILDVCESAGNLYVLEIGCINSAGFYACDIGKIIRSVTELVKVEYEQLDP